MIFPTNANRLEPYKYAIGASDLTGGGENLRKIWIIAAGVLALAAVAILTIVGVSPNGAYAWFSIQSAMNSVSDSVVKSSGAYAWF